MPTVAVIGPGAIGGVIAAWVGATAEHEVIVCARTPFERLRVDLPGGRTLTSSPRVLLDPAEARHVDWIVAATKAYDTSGAARWIERLDGGATRLAIAQNGVEHATRFAALVPAARTLPVVCEVSAERSAPGAVRQRGAGRLTVPAGDLGSAFARLFGGGLLEVEPTSDWTTAAWRKLALNAAGVVQALTRTPARVMRRPAIAELARGLAAEAIAVGRAEGADLSPRIADEIVERLRGAAPESANSLLADRLANRPLEVDARNGAVVRIGARHGIATPLNAMAVALLEAHETT